MDKEGKLTQARVAVNWNELKDSDAVKAGEFDVIWTQLGDDGPTAPLITVDVNKYYAETGQLRDTNSIVGDSVNAVRNALAGVSGTYAGSVEVDGKKVSGDDIQRKVRQGTTIEQVQRSEARKVDTDDETAVLAETGDSRTPKVNLHVIGVTGYQGEDAAIFNAIVRKRLASALPGGHETVALIEMLVASLISEPEGKLRHEGLRRAGLVREYPKYLASVERQTTAIVNGEVSL